MRKTFLFFILSSFLFYSFAIADTYTVTAPSLPVGVYDQIRLMPQNSAPGAPNPCQNGTIYVGTGAEAPSFCKNNSWESIASGDAIWTRADPAPGAHAATPPLHYASFQTALTPDSLKLHIGQPLGTSTLLEIPKLTLDNFTDNTGANQDGGIMAKGTQGVDLPTGGLSAGTYFYWYPKKSALRAGAVTGTEWNDANVGNNSIAFGNTATASANATTVSGGGSNSASGFWSGIGGGFQNTASGQGSFVGGGAQNLASGNYSFVGGGGTTDYCDHGCSTDPLGGSPLGNKAVGHYATVIGGGWDRAETNNGDIRNIAQGDYAVIGGGVNNLAWSNSSVIIGGGDEGGDAIDSGHYWSNYIAPLSHLSVIGGGVSNKSYGQGNFVGGGNFNFTGTVDNGAGTGCSFASPCRREAFYSVVGGGYANRIPINNQDTGGVISYGTIIGGDQNTINNTSEYLTIGGGQANNFGQGSVYTTYSAIGGGTLNFNRDSYSFIGGGTNNVIPINGHHGTILGGQNNQATGAYSFVGGGANNIAAGNSSIVAGGSNNTAGAEYSWAGGENIKIASTAAHTFVWGVLNGEILSGTVSAAGSGYAVGNILTVQQAGSSGTGTFVVTSIDVGGIVSTIELVNLGSNYTTANNLATTGGSGSGCRISIRTDITQANSFIIWPDRQGTVGIGVPQPLAKLDISAPTVNDIAIGLSDVTGYPHGESTLIIKSPPNFGTNGCYTHKQVTGGLPEYFLEYTDSPAGCVWNDLAEIFDAVDSVTPGDVLVVDPQGTRKLQKTSQPYDPKVVGVVSSAPAVLFEGTSSYLGPGKDVASDKRPAISLAGRVICKVSLENGPIEYGDLLTTSSIPGYAMKATDENRSLGSIVGKALEPFDGGPTKENKGFIAILVSLQ